MKRIFGLTLVALLWSLPVHAQAFTNTNRLCATPPTAPNVVSWNYYVTTAPNSATILKKVTVPVAAVVAGPAGDIHACPAGKVGVAVSALALADAPTLYVKASSTSSNGNESPKSNEVSLSPLDNSTPDAPLNLEVR